MKAKKLIEVAMPIKEISAESVRDKSIRHGHISTLHLWWARRPLPTCRAVVFASLVPDPLDPNCPQAFKDAVEDILCTGIAKSIYAPYPDIPYTAIFDPMEDNLRNRLLMFIGKFSDKCQANMIAGKSTSPKEQLQEGCLIKWESKNDETVLNRARKLIWVAYNSERRPEADYSTLAEEFEAAWENIKLCETNLYSIPNRHIESREPNAEINVAQRSLDAAIATFQSFMPSVFDPFAGGGAIPLEAARLGCRSYGNDINPVAHIIEKGSVEFPQKYGKPITYTRDEFMRLYGEFGLKLLEERNLSFYGDEVTIPNHLSFDVEFFASILLDKTQKEKGYLYPKDEYGNNPVAFYWARTAKCNNPSCNADIPLLKQFYLANTSTSKLYIDPIIEGGFIDFQVKSGLCNLNGWNNRCTITCPCCGSIKDPKELKHEFVEKRTGERLIAIIWESGNRKDYRIATQEQILDASKTEEVVIPSEEMPKNDSQNLKLPLWGFYSFGEMFNNRQLQVLNSFVDNFKELKRNMEMTAYNIAIFSYLAIIIDKLTDYYNTNCTWHNGRETIGHLFSKQAIPMVFDYAETNPFSNSSGCFKNMIDWVVRYIESESSYPVYATCCNTSSGEKEQFPIKSITAVVTDPPYYDAIAYADLSDFFYVWLKRNLSDVYPLIMSTPQTPKADECTAIKCRHTSIQKAKKHFENKLLEIFQSIEQQTSDIVSIMFAHQSTEAWTTLCNSILGANMNIQGSWAMDTEMVNRSIGLSGDALESSVTVACTPSERKGYGSYKKVKQAIQHKVEQEVRSLYELGFRGADLLTACFGKAVSEFGNYEHVEKADGSEVTVAELLDMARSAAFTALIRDFASDDYTKFYIGWLQLNGLGETDYDDATKFTRAGMNVNISDIFAHDILVKNETGNTQHLGSYKERAKQTLVIPAEDAPLIDKVHHAMYYWKEEDHGRLLQLIAAYGQDKNNEFWRVLTVLKELLPEGDDREQVVSLLNNADTLIQSSKSGPAKAVQSTFDFGE